MYTWAQASARRSSRPTPTTPRACSEWLTQRCSKPSASTITRYPSRRSAVKLAAVLIAPQRRAFSSGDEGLFSGLANTGAMEALCGGGTDGNEQLTATTGAVLILLLAV